MKEIRLSIQCSDCNRILCFSLPSNISYNVGDTYDKCKFCLEGYNFVRRVIS